MDAGTADLRRNLGRYLKRVRSGERIVVTDRGTAVAELIPFGSPKGTRADAVALARVVSSGQITPPARPLGKLPLPVAMDESRSLSAAVLEDRNGR